MTTLSQAWSRKRLLTLVCALAGALLCACGDDDDSGSEAAGMGGPGGGPRHSDQDAGENDSGTSAVSSKFSFFVSSQTNKTGDLEGLKGADERCNKLAKAVGAGDRTWHAYLSTEHGGDDGDASDGGPVNARDRIGKGPWYNVKGDLLAQNLDALHARKGDANLFLDEKGHKINGHWTGSPSPVEHDILTGSNADGTVLKGKTCDDWTSSSKSISAQVGHSDGFGPNQATTGSYTSWNSAHANMDCSDTAPLGGAGRIYCFAID